MGDNTTSEMETAKALGRLAVEDYGETVTRLDTMLDDVDPDTDAERVLIARGVRSVINDMERPDDIPFAVKERTGLVTIKALSKANDVLEGEGDKEAFDSLVDTVHDLHRVLLDEYDPITDPDVTIGSIGVDASESE